MVLATALSPTAVTATNHVLTTNHHRRLLDLLNQCTSMSELKQIHAHTLRTTSTTHPHTLFLHSRILHFSSLHDLPYALLFFHTHIQNPNSFAWNTVIRACARSIHRKQDAILLYLNMMCQGNVTPDKHSFPFVLKACAYLFALSEGRQLHAQIVKLGLASDVYINNSLIHFYGSCGSLEDARDLFLEMPERSVVSWNVMIDTLVQLNEFDDALMCFREMQESFEADSFAIQSVLRACAGLGALSLGMWAHAYILKRCNPEVADDVLVNNYLLDMYCKCGSLDNAKFIFERMAKRDVTSWNTMILGFAMHGQAVGALQYLRRMVDEGRLMPNSITFSGVLSACRHSGMVEEGRNYFTVMTTQYGIEPVLEHYGCLVDLLARAGLIAEALDVVSNMPIKPDAVIWRSILDACSKRTMGVEVSEEMAKKIMESEEGSGVYMLLSRVYAVARKWDEVGAVRKLMAEKGVAKEPGCSTIEIDGVAHEFFAVYCGVPKRRHVQQWEVLLCTNSLQLYSIPNDILLAEPPNVQKMFLPQLVWYEGIVPQMILAGFLPFSVIKIQLYDNLSTVWGHGIYTFYNSLAIMFVLLLIITSVVSVMLTSFGLLLKIMKGGGGRFSMAGLLDCMCMVTVSITIFICRM